MIRGIDVSSYQASVDWRQVKISGFGGLASIKCCDAVLHGGKWTPYEDSLHQRHVLGARAQDIPTQSYAFFHPSCDVKLQADFFVSHTWLDQLRPVLDCESLSQGQVPINAAEAADEWCSMVLASTGAKPIIYASTSYANAMAKQLTSIVEWDLWAAEYHSPPNPNETIHAPGWRVLAIQYAGDVKLDGVIGLADLDVVCGQDLSLLYV